MEIGFSGRQVIISEKYITLLDRFVLDFVNVLKEKTSYVIVSGYLAVLFGRSRGTEDIDILIPHMEEDTFGVLHMLLLEEGYEILNAEGETGLYDMLKGRMGVRVAKKGQCIPNIKLKFIKDDIDRCVMKDRLDIRFGGESLFISPVEIQIPYRIFLGSEKDIEDAVYLWEIFRDYLDRENMKTWMKRFSVNGEDYGIGP